MPLAYVFAWALWRSGGDLLLMSLLHAAINAHRVWFETDLFPGLSANDDWLLVYLALVLGLGLICAWQLRRVEMPKCA